ncbi:MAG: hypothetical protein U1F77_07885 [Kiritimatiellia bacterium]
MLAVETGEKASVQLKEEIKRQQAEIKELSRHRDEEARKAADTAKRLAEKTGEWETLRAQLAEREKALSAATTDAQDPGGAGQDHLRVEGLRGGARETGHDDQRPRKSRRGKGRPGRAIAGPAGRRSKETAALEAHRKQLEERMSRRP